MRIASPYSLGAVDGVDGATVERRGNVGSGVLGVSVGVSVGSWALGAAVGVEEGSDEVGA